MARTPSKPARRLLSREELLAPRRRTFDIDVSEFWGDGAVVTMQGLTARQSADVDRAARDREADGSLGERDELLYKVLLISEALVEPKLAPDDVQALLEQDCVIVGRLYQQALECIATAADVEAAKDSFPAGRDG